MIATAPPLRIVHAAGPAAKAAGEDSCGCGSSKPVLVQIGEIGGRA